MPEISRLLGIIIGLFYREHGPAHRHAFYSGHRITVDIESGNVTGAFPWRALAHVQEWRELHKTELLENWRIAGEGKQ